MDREYKTREYERQQSRWNIQKQKLWDTENLYRLISRGKDKKHCIRTLNTITTKDKIILLREIYEM